MTYQEKIIDKAYQQIGDRWIGRNSNLHIGSNIWWNYYKTEFIDKIRKKVNEHKLYCEIVDKNGNLFLTTKGSKKINFDEMGRNSDLSFAIKFRLRGADRKREWIKPERFNILCENLEGEDISLVFTTALNGNGFYMLTHEKSKDLEIQYKFYYNEDYTQITGTGKGEVSVYYMIRTLHLDFPDLLTLNDIQWI